MNESTCCPACRSPLRAGLKFCPSCGKPVEQSKIVTPPSVAPATKQCPNCRATIRADLKFCNKCGASTIGQPQPTAQVSRQTAKSKQKLSSLGERVWDVITMAGCTAVSGVWYWYSGMAETQPDYKTCAAIVLIPLALIIFRRRLDRALMPLQGILNKIPRMVRLGIGLAVPFLVSNYLYASGSSNFPFMLKTTVLSILASFVILRNPSIPGANIPIRRNS